MRTLAHLSDLHFGRVGDHVLQALANSVIAAHPDLVVISGDLTQRARTHEFQQARRFLDKLPQPRLVVPGNHDVPLYNLLARWLHPLQRYRTYISGDVEPSYHDSEIAVLGINTARSLTFKGGRINRAQVERSCMQFGGLPPGLVHIVVTHHPLELPEQFRPRRLARRAQMAMIGFANCRVDLILSGHLHISHAGETSGNNRYSAVVVQAGTASSDRGRGELNSWNRLKVSPSSISVERLEWDPVRANFLPRKAAYFRHAGPTGWIRKLQEPAA